MPRVITVLTISFVVILSSISSVMAADLYEVRLNSPAEAEVLRKSGADALVRLETGYLVLLSKPEAAQLSQAGVDISGLASDIARNELALPLRLDGAGCEGLEVLFEQDGLKLYRVTQEFDDAHSVQPVIMRLPESPVPIRFQARPEQVPAPSLKSSLLDLVDQVDQDTILYYTEKLQAIGQRVAGTVNNYKSRDSIVSWFQSFGYDSVYTDQFWAYISGQNRACFNVVCVKPGLVYPDVEIVIGGHFDGVPNSPAADDNGSGTVATLEIARVLADVPTDVTYKFIAFDGEEYGLYGSWDYATMAASRGDNIILMYNMDMIAYYTNTNRAKLYNGYGSIYEQMWYVLGPNYGLSGVNAGSISASDHWPFYQRGFEVLCLHEYDFSTVYHTYRDSTTYMNFDYFKRMTQASLAVVLAAGDTDDLDGDGIAEDVDNCPGLYNPSQLDPDGDLVGSACDNCPDVYNPDQLDMNDDGIGDHCDGFVHIMTFTLPNGVVSEPYFAQFEAIGGTEPYSWNHLSGDLPLGCQFNQGTDGTLTGTPTFASVYIFTVEVSDQSLPTKADTLQYILTVDPPAYICGDADDNSEVTLGDAVYVINYVFGAGPAPVHTAAADSNCDGQLSIGDSVHIINFIFGGGPPPCASCT